MPVQVTTVMLAVENLDRSKKFYGEGLGCAIDQDYPTFVSFNLGEGSSSLALYQREAAAADAGVPSDGSGFRGVSLHYIVSSKEAVDDVIGKALAAVRDPNHDEHAHWTEWIGGRFDPDEFDQAAVNDELKDFA